MLSTEQSVHRPSVTLLDHQLVALELGVMSLPIPVVARSREGETVDGSALGATSDEVIWAQQIKEAAATSGLGNLSDFEYLQHAIVAKANVYKAVRRIQRLTEFRARYKLSNANTDNAMAMLRSAEALFPGFFGGSGIDDEGRVIQHLNFAAFEPAKLTSHKQWRDFMGAMYHMMQAATCDVQSIRSGSVFLADCGGLSWGNFSFEVERRCTEFLQDAYPFRSKHFYFLDAPGILSVMVGICRVFLSEKMKATLQSISSVQYYGKTNLPAYLVPGDHGGSARPQWNYKFIEERLKARAINQEKFRL